MERLTRRAPGGYALIEGKQLGSVRTNREVINRLAEYENCGLEPDDLHLLVLFAKEMSRIFIEGPDIYLKKQE